VRVASLYTPAANTINQFSGGGTTLVIDGDGKAQTICDANQYGNVNEFVHADDALAEVEKAIAAAVPAS